MLQATADDSADTGPQRVSRHSSLLPEKETETLARIALAQRLPPPFVVEIPLYGRLDPGFEGDCRLPAELGREPPRVDGVAPVMAGPVRHVGDQLAMRSTTWPTPVQAIADAADHLVVGALIVGPDMVLPPGLARAQ